MTGYAVDIVGVGTALPVAGPAAILLVIITVLVRLWFKASEETGLVRSAYAAEIKRLNEAHDAELAELRRDIAELREGVDRLNARLDQERELRRQAEDKAAEALRRLGGTPAQ